MTTDPRIGWAQPEQNGPALKLWTRISEVASPTNLSAVFPKAMDYIPLTTQNGIDVCDSTAMKNMINVEKNYGGKRKRSDYAANLNVVDTIPVAEQTTPWKKLPSYPGEVMG